MNNIGCVLYKKGQQPGTLDATWCHPWFGQGVVVRGQRTQAAV